MKAYEIIETCCWIIKKNRNIRRHSWGPNSLEHEDGRKKQFEFQLQCCIPWVPDKSFIGRQTEHVRWGTCIDVLFQRVSVFNWYLLLLVQSNHLKVFSLSLSPRIEKKIYNVWEERSEENKLTEEGGSNVLGGCNPKFKNLYFALTIIGVIKSKGIGWMGPEVRKPHGGAKA